MKGQKLIDKIKSQYILKGILNYAKDTNFTFKLFIHSKRHQKRLSINLVIYKENYLKSLGFDINSYLIKEENLSQKYNNFLLENGLNKEKFEKIIYDVMNEEDSRIIKEDFETKICIDSPLFDLISKTKNFENNYTIFISQPYIDEYKLKNDYIAFFNRLNGSNIQYSSIYYKFKEINKINYLKEFNIDFNKIRRITLICDKNDNTKNSEKNKCISEAFFSFDNINNNLIYLKMKINLRSINPKLFQPINGFKSLNYLFIERIRFYKMFRIKTNNLKIISCKYCSNVNIVNSENKKELKLDLFNKNNISDIKVLENTKLEILNLERCATVKDLKNIENINFKNLIELNLTDNGIVDINSLVKMNLEKLEKLNMRMNIMLSDISALEKVKFKGLQELNLSCNYIFEIKTLKKVNFRNLKHLDLSSNRISDIKILEFADFKELKKLDLSSNNISDIQVLDKVNFKKLEILGLGRNQITNIN